MRHTVAAKNVQSSHQNLACDMWRASKRSRANSTTKKQRIATSVQTRVKKTVGKEFIFGGCIQGELYVGERATGILVVLSVLTSPFADLSGQKNFKVATI